MKKIQQNFIRNIFFLAVTSTSFFISSAYAGCEIQHVMGMEIPYCSDSISTDTSEYIQYKQAHPDKPTISVSISPSTVHVGESYTVSWNATNATKVTHSCNGGYTGDYLYSETSTHSHTDIASTNYLGLSNCTFIAEWPGGVATDSASLSILPPGSTSSEASVNSINTINGESFVSGKSVKNGKSITFQGKSKPGKYVVIRSTGTKGIVEWNQTTDSSGNWSLSTITSDFPLGVMYFFVSYQDGEEQSFFINIVSGGTISWTPKNIQCSVNGGVSTTNVSAEYGSVVNCSVSSSDSNTKAWISAGQTSWGDIDSTKNVLPQVNSQVPGKYSNGVYSVQLVADYHGYTRWRDIWFQNSSGVSDSITIHMFDSSSDDYKKAQEYLKKKYSTSTNSNSTSAGTSDKNNSSQTTSTNSTSTNNVSIWESEALKVTTVSIDGKSYSYTGQEIIVPAGKSLTLIGRWPKSSLLSFGYTNSADFIGSGINPSGDWSIFGIGTIYKKAVSFSGSTYYTITSDKGGSVVVKIKFITTTWDSKVQNSVVSGEKPAVNWGQINTTSDIKSTSQSDVVLSSDEKKSANAVMIIMKRKIRSLSKEQALLYIGKIEHTTRVLGNSEKNIENSRKYRLMKYLIPRFSVLREQVTSN